MASSFPCSPEIYQLKQTDSGQDFFIGPLSAADICPVFTNLMYSCGIKDTHSSSKKPVFYLGAVSLLISTKKRTAPQRRREKKKDGELAVGKTEQRIMEYYAGAIHPESGLRRCYLSFSNLSYPSWGAYCMTLQIVGTQSIFTTTRSHQPSVSFSLGECGEKKEWGQAVHTGEALPLHTLLISFLEAPSFPLSGFWYLARAHSSVSENLFLLQPLNKTSIHFPRWNHKRNMKANCT